MGMDSILSYCITALGTLLCLFSMVFIFLGKKIAGGSGTPQVVNFKGLEVRTDAVVMLFIVSVLVVALPLLLLHYRPLPTPIVATPPVPAKFYITGNVHQPDGSPLEGAQVQVLKNGSIQNVNEQPDGLGNFSTEIELREGEQLKIITTKDGYINQTLFLSRESLTYPTVLVHRTQ
jgi:hypothetical protein